MTSIPLLTGMLVKLLINAVFLPPACPKTSRLVRVCPPTPTSKTRLTSGRQIRFSKFEVNGICTVRYRYTVARHTIMLGLRIGGIGYGDRSSVHRRPANRVGVGAPNLTLAVGVADGASSVDADDGAAGRGHASAPVLCQHCHLRRIFAAAGSTTRVLEHQFQAGPPAQ